MGSDWAMRIIAPLLDDFVSRLAASEYEPTWSNTDAEPFAAALRAERIATEARVRDDACNALNAWYRGETRHESPIAAIRAAGKENEKS